MKHLKTHQNFYICSPQKNFPISILPIPKFRLRRFGGLSPACGVGSVDAAAGAPAAAGAAAPARRAAPGGAGRAAELHRGGGEVPLGATGMGWLNVKGLVVVRKETGTKHHTNGMKQSISSSFMDKTPQKKMTVRSSPRWRPSQSVCTSSRAVIPWWKQPAAPPMASWPTATLVIF